MVSIERGGWDSGGAMLHVSAYIGPNRCFTVSVVQGESVDDVVGAWRHDGQHDPCLYEVRALVGYGLFSPAFCAYILPIVTDDFYWPWNEGVPPTEIEVVGVNFLADTVESDGLITWGETD